MAARRVADLGVVVVVVSMLWTSGRAFTPADNYIVLCGTGANATTADGRAFVGDVYLPSSALTGPQSVMANASAGAVSGSDTASLYEAARIFTSPSSYTFAVKKRGHHFVRLHFFPFRYQSYDLASAAFSVSAQGVVLVDGFSAKSGTASPVVREFLVNVNGDALAISFTPTGRLAFVNAIEVVSVPDELIGDTAQVVNPRSQYAGLSSQALETVHRINMGNPKITPKNDTLWRTWLPDQSFLVDNTVVRRVAFPIGNLKHMGGFSTAVTAPDPVYATATELASTANVINARFNMTWQFDVAARSDYLLRLHFCDIVSKAAHQLVFNVYVGAWLVLQDFDMSADTFGSLAVPMYKDFVLSANDAASAITVSIEPSTVGNVVPDGILNGLEIMRIIGSSGSADDTSPLGRSKSKNTVAIVASSAVGAFAVVMALGFAAFRVFRRRKKVEKQASNTWTPFSASALGSRSRSRSFGKGSSGSTTITLGQNSGLGYRFPLAVLQEATGGFDEGMVIGVGGFGKVYKGALRDGTRVAVKRGNRQSQQGRNEFRTEIELLSRLRHRHLVSLIGYCDERNEMVLVYDYMARGTLRSHLYGSDHPPLTWKQRLEACVGAARGLHYLHTGSAKAIIHRDVKSANILLDDNFMAKVADFGLSKTGPELDKTHVSTAVKGSFGYLDPEYYRRQMLTEKSDVYSFGVVLLEVLCSRAVIDPTLPRDMVNLAEWAMPRLKRGELDRIVDERIAGMMRPESLKKFGDTAEKCLAEYGVERPTMGDVLWSLEFALQLQEASPDSSGSGGDGVSLVAGASSDIQSIASVAADATVTSNLGDLNGMSMRKVFSKMIKGEGEGR